MRNDPRLNSIYPVSHGNRENRETGETERFLNVRDRQPRPSQLAICDFSLSTRQRSQFPHLVAWPLGHFSDKQRPPDPILRFHNDPRTTAEVGMMLGENEGGVDRLGDRTRKNYPGERFPPIEVIRSRLAQIHKANLSRMSARKWHRHNKSREP